jgi:hypothetical protein
LPTYITSTEEILWGIILVAVTPRIRLVNGGAHDAGPGVSGSAIATFPADAQPQIQVRGDPPFFSIK